MSGSIRGFLFKSELRPTGSTVSLSNHTSLAIEGEMAVRIGVESQVACAFPVIELHNYVFPRCRASPRLGRPWKLEGLGLYSNASIGMLEKNLLKFWKIRNLPSTDAATVQRAPSSAMRLTRDKVDKFGPTGGPP